MKLSPHFGRHEFACKCGCGFDTVDSLLLDVLENLRHHFSSPVVINSACRCADYNDNVIKGSKNSQHKYGRAADVVVKGVQPADVYNYLDKLYGNTVSLGSYETFTHVDTRTKGGKRW